MLEGEDKGCRYSLFWCRSSLVEVGGIDRDGRDELRIGILMCQGIPMFAVLDEFAQALE